RIRKAGCGRKTSPHFSSTRFAAIGGPRPMDLLKIDALAKTPLQIEPYEYVVVEDFLDAGAQGQILGGFPDMPDAGSFPLSELEVGPGLQALFDALEGPEFRKAVEHKF